MITSVEQLIDITNATRPVFEGDAAAMTFNDVSHELFNTVFEKADETSGTMMEWDVTLGDTGNAQLTGLYGEDKKNVKNMTKKGYAHWTHATTNVTFDIREPAMNSGSVEKLYDVLQNRINNMYREFAELLQPTLLLTPQSAADELNPHGLAAWLPLGTAGQDGGFNAYQPVYNDGSYATQYAPGTIACSPSANQRWAAYFADHQGKLGDRLIHLLDSAILSTGFRVTRIPKAVDKDTSWGNLRFYTNKKVILNLTKLARKGDDAIGPNFDKYLNAYTYMGAPFMYVPELDSDNPKFVEGLHGSDPIYAVNWDWLKCKCLTGFKFKLQEAYKNTSLGHTVMTLPLDLTYCVFSPNRQRVGFKIAKHPGESN